MLWMLTVMFAFGSNLVRIRGSTDRSLGIFLTWVAYNYVSTAVIFVKTSGCGTGIATNFRPIWNTC